MAIKKILRLGNPDLLTVSEIVKSNELEYAKVVGTDLKDTMQEFHQRYGWGRAIAAPQIGVKKRIVFSQTTEEKLLINPEIVETSKEMIELWDDCMSFPDLLVKVKRYKSCKIKFINENGIEIIVDFNDNLSELIQHEIDHLDGILATMRAIDGKSFCLRSEKYLLNGSTNSNVSQN